MEINCDTKRYQYFENLQSIKHFQHYNLFLDNKLINLVHNLLKPNWPFVDFRIVTSCQLNFGFAFEMMYYYYEIEEECAVGEVV